MKVEDSQDAPMVRDAMIGDFHVIHGDLQHEVRVGRAQKFALGREATTDSCALVEYLRTETCRGSGRFDEMIPCPLQLPHLQEVWTPQSSSEQASGRPSRRRPAPS
eukprot:754027-Hanusia_phi.AAC.2